MRIFLNADYHQSDTPLNSLAPHSASVVKPSEFWLHKAFFKSSLPTPPTQFLTVALRPIGAVSLIRADT